MTRPGHHRPLGTLARKRFPNWDGPFQPELGDLVSQETTDAARDTHLHRRSYIIDGIEETKTGYTLHMRRVPYLTPDPDQPNPRTWNYHNLPRPTR